MFRLGRKAAIAVSMVALTSAAAGGVLAASRSSDEDALAPARRPADQTIESRVNGLLSRMTLEEKLEQIQLLPDFLVTDDEVKRGLGSVLSQTDPKEINRLQHIAVDQSRLHIPMLFAFDTIHGFRTIFPIPLGAASSFDPSVASDDHTIGARESAAVGLKQIYSPMVDVSHEPRWGRISEAGGEDPYLNSVFAAARVKAAQGTDYSAPDKVVTSVKHYAAYGQPEGGRDYNTTDMCDAGFAEAVAAAQSADQVVLALGETREMSGEAAARSDIDLPGKQQDLIEAIKATGKPFVVVLFNGRPLTLQKVDAQSPAILEAWFPGVQAGTAVADVLFGKVNPGGKLPVLFPRRLGQVPIYYIHEPTGRPCDTSQKYVSR